MKEYPADYSYLDDLIASSNKRRRNKLDMDIVPNIPPFLGFFLITRNDGWPKAAIVTELGPHHLVKSKIMIAL